MKAYVMHVPAMTSGMEEPPIASMVVGAGAPTCSQAWSLEARQTPSRPRALIQVWVLAAVGAVRGADLAMPLRLLSVLHSSISAVRYTVWTLAARNPSRVWMLAPALDASPSSAPVLAHYSQLKYQKAGYSPVNLLPGNALFKCLNIAPSCLFLYIFLIESRHFYTLNFCHISIYPHYHEWFVSIILVASK